MLGRDRNLESGLVSVELQRDYEHFERFDNFLGTSEDFFINLSGGGVFGDWKHLGFDLCFGFGFVGVERSNGEYFGDGVTFEDGCFEEEMEFGRMQKHIGDFG